MELVTENLGPTDAELMRKSWAAVLEGLEKNQHLLPARSFVEADGDLERVLRFESATVRDSVRASLQKRFGFTRMDLSPEAVIAKILRRGKLIDETELQVVQDALSGDCGDLDPVKVIRLGKLLVAYGTK